MKWILLVPLILIAVLATILIIMLLTVVSVRLRYADGELYVWVKIYGIRIRVYPLRQKKSKKIKNTKKSITPDKAPVTPQKDTTAYTTAPTDEGQTKPKMGFDALKIDFKLYTEYARLGIEASKRMLHNMKIAHLILHLKISTDDAAQTAMLYGGAAVATSTLLPIVESAFKVGKKDIFIEADFEGKESELSVDIKISTVAWKMAASAVIILLKFRKIMKGRRNNE